ncbi:bacterioferritin, partial [Staphylococcus aureus]|nr:bacterioferritin [Staphylococcus aureus]
MQEETEHAAWLIRRILFLGGTPAMVPSALNIGSDVPSMMKSDLELEYQVVRDVRAAMGTCEQEHDY